MTHFDDTEDYWVEHPDELAFEIEQAEYDDYLAVPSELGYNARAIAAIAAEREAQAGAVEEWINGDD